MFAHLGRVRAVPRLYEVYPGISLPTEERAWENLSQGSRRDIFPRDSLVDVVTGLGARRRRVYGSIAGKAKVIILFQICRPPGWPTCPPVTGNSFFGG